MIVLKDSLARHPDDYDTLQALISFSGNAGDREAALKYAEHLLKIAPADPNVSRLIQSFRKQLAKPAVQ
jgi:Flp pilus assembly protein TadD